MCDRDWLNGLARSWFNPPIFLCASAALGVPACATPYQHQRYTLMHCLVRRLVKAGAIVGRVGPSSAKVMFPGGYFKRF